MKKIALTIIGIILSFSIFAQSPYSFKYQAVARDASGNSICNQEIGIKISILQSDANGTTVFEESFQTITNQFGLVALNIGTGTLIDGDISEINWGEDTFFIKIEMDLAGGTNYVEFGTSQLLSVPYALYANTAENATNYNETDPLFGSWDKSTGITISENQISDLEHFTNEDEIDPTFNNSIASGITTDDTLNWNNKLSSYTETDPTFNSWDKSSGIEIFESQITDLQDYIVVETDPEFAAWNKSSGITISEDQISDLQHFTNNDEIDPIYNNSIASGITANDTLNWNSKISSYTETDPLFNLWDKSSGIVITESQISDLDHFTNEDETDPLYSAWDKSYSDLVNTPSIVDTINNILDTTTQFIRTELDGDATNEIQTLSLGDNILSIENGNDIDLSNYLDNTDNQNLNLNGSVLEISNGTSADLSSLQADGSETKIDAGESITVSGSGTNADPYIISASKTYSIGLDTTLGGYVFYVTPNGKHGIVVSMQDQSTSTQWWEARNELNKPENHNSYGKNFTDWRLPTMNELVLLEAYRTHIGVVSSSNGYWSSMGYSQGNTYARYYLFNYTPNERFGYMSDYRRARAVRSF